MDEIEKKEALLLGHPDSSSHVSDDGPPNDKRAITALGRKLHDVSLGYGASDEEFQFSPVRTAPICVFLLILIVVVEIQLFGEFYGEDYRYILAPSVLLGLLTLSYVFVRHEHARLRQIGYLHFYIRANKYFRNSFFMLTLSDVGITIIFIFYPNSGTTFTKKVIFDLIITLAMAVVGGFISMYFSLVTKFNRKKEPPDALVWQQTQGIRDDNGADLRGTPEGMRSVIQKQALMIRRMEKQSQSLTQELRQARQQNKFSNITSKKADFDALLSARDAEIRTLRVERDHLRQEQKQTTTDLDELRKANGLLQKEHQSSVSELEKSRASIRVLEKDKAQLQILVEVHKDTNKEMQQLIESLRAPETS